MSSSATEVDITTAEPPLSPIGVPGIKLNSVHRSDATNVSRPASSAGTGRAPTPVRAHGDVTPGPSLAPSGDIEMHAVRNSDSAVALDISTEGEREVRTLAPVDKGRAAWSFLIAATIIETIVWGLPWSVGILHNYWSTEMFEGAEGTLTLAATLQSGLMYMSAALLGPFFSAYPQYERYAQYLGLTVATVALIASAFVTQPWHLLVTIGIFYPFAGALYMPCATLIFEWFYDRRGIATGIMFAGTGVGGTVFPFVVAGLLGKLGYKATMISLGVGFGILCGISLLFIKRRVPVARVGPTPGNVSRWQMAGAQLKRPVVWLSIAVILLTGMGNFIPSLWIPTYAEHVRATRPNGTALVALMNAASVPGNTLTGYFSDRYPTRVVVPLSCMLSAVSCLVLWGLGTSDPLLVTFSIFWGLTALSSVGTWSKMITILSKDDANLPTLIFSVFAMLKGVGSLTSGPISSALLKTSINGKGAYGTNYGLLIIYSGLLTFVGAIPALFFPVK